MKVLCSRCGGGDIGVGDIGLGSYKQILFRSRGLQCFASYAVSLIPNTEIICMSVTRAFDSFPGALSATRLDSIALDRASMLDKILHQRQCAATAQELF